MYEIYKSTLALKSGRILEIYQEENGMYVATIKEFCPYRKRWITVSGSIAKTMSEIWAWVKWQKEKPIKGRIY